MSKKTNGSSATIEKAAAGSPALDRDQVAERAYELWCTRGCPDGDADQDWFDAENQLRTRSIPSNDSKSAARSR